MIKKLAIVPLVLIGWLSMVQVGSGQLINLKTAPIATGDQFAVYPQVNAGMASVSIAVDDSVGDAFVNPAKNGRLEGTRIFLRPDIFRIAEGYGGARTLGVGGLTRGGEWFGGIGVAIQQMDRPSWNSGRLANTAANNQYVWGQAGKHLSESATMGTRIFWGGLKAMGGVDLLYSGNPVEQSGYLLDMRVGLDIDMKQGRLDLMGVYSRMDMTHEVTNRWSRNPRFLPVPGNVRPQTEKNLDITNTWGLHVGYDQPAGDEGWQMGGVFTFNYKTHPKIPNYDLMNIARDPGDTWAFNVGVGGKHTSEEATTFAVDLILEPIWSYTWANAQQDIVDPETEQVVVAKGEKTIENDFDFMNTALKTGVRKESDKFVGEFGVKAKSYHYWLEQKDNIRRTTRNQEENWTEWRFSLGLGYKFEDMTVKYTGQLTAGTGRPGIASGFITQRNLAATSGDFIFAPEGSLSLDRARVTTHLISFIIKL